MKIIPCLCLLAVPVFAQLRPAPGASVDTIANLPAQPIGANDLLVVMVYDAPEMTRTVRVGADGLIRLPMLKQQIKAQGLMPEELETAVAGALQDEELLVDPFVTVTVAEYHSRPISVMGAVKKPLTFQADGPVTLLEALARAEGLSLEAGPEILVTRKPAADDSAPPRALVQRIPVHNLIDAADPEVNLQLLGGEEIRVPEAGKIFVVGNVKKPGAYIVQDNSGATLLTALAVSEGLLPYAADLAYLYRRESAAGNKNEIPVKLKKIMDRKAPDIPLQANDILYIPDNRGRRLTAGALEKLLGVGGGVTSALVYTLR
jgi:polysaccharide biosynthesis/export protein